MKRRTFLSLMGAAALTSSMMLTGCGAGSGDDRKIVRIGHVQSQTHPDHLDWKPLPTTSTRSWAISTAWRCTPASCWAPRPKWCS